MQMMMETTEPVAVARPIGRSVIGNIVEARYASGMRAHVIEMTLWMNEISERPYAQKYPLKQKWMPAKMQSMT